jgi:hypothetical protein
MPWTFAHAAAVLPLRRCCPRRLHFPALVIGSLTPDFGRKHRASKARRFINRYFPGIRP